MAWKAAVVEGNERDIQEKCPGRRNYEELCFREPQRKKKQVTWADPHQDENAAAEVQYKSNTTAEATENDAEWDFHDGKPNYAEWGEGEDVKPDVKKENGNTMMYIVLAGGVVLAFMFSRQ